jgi:hypothetical protein
VDWEDENWDKIGNCGIFWGIWRGFVGERGDWEFGGEFVWEVEIWILLGFCWVGVKFEFWSGILFGMERI